MASAHRVKYSEDQGCLKFLFEPVNGRKKYCDGRSSDPQEAANFAPTHDNCMAPPCGDSFVIALSVLFPGAYRVQNLFLPDSKKEADDLSGPPGLVFCIRPSKI